jgi:hypothetical protein
VISSEMLASRLSSQMRTSTGMFDDTNYTSEQETYHKRPDASDRRLQILSLFPGPGIEAF